MSGYNGSLGHDYIHILGNYYAGAVPKMMSTGPIVFQQPASGDIVQSRPDVATEGLSEASTNGCSYVAPNSRLARGSSEGFGQYNNLRVTHESLAKIYLPRPIFLNPRSPAHCAPVLEGVQVDAEGQIA